MNAKAGDGLPSIEKGVIRYLLIPIIRLLMTWNLALFLLKRERKIIEKLVSNLPHEMKGKRVKINRVFAIEEHSSDFSVNMVCEHLYIAGTAVMGVIDTLSKEQEFKRDIKIEAVKPKGEDDNAIENFKSFMDKYEAYIRSHKKNQSKMTKAHPWFINFNNCDWSCFMFMHTFIHRRQIQEIVKVLGEENE